MQLEKTELKFETGNNKEYKVITIKGNVIYIRELELSYLPGLYYLIL